MTLSTQKELSAVNHAVDIRKHNTPQVAKTKAEPAGRAKSGQAFSA